MKTLIQVFAALGLTIAVYWMVVFGGREMFGVDYETVAFFAALGTFVFSFFGLVVNASVASDPESREDDGVEVEDPGTPLCMTCLAPAEKLQHFCDQCGSPLTSHAAIDPVGQVRSVGSMVSKATSAPPRRIVLIGIWLIFGVPVVLMAFLFGTLGPPDSYGLLDFVLRIVLLLGVLGLYIAILVKTTRNYFRRKNEAEHAPRGDEIIDEAP